MTSPSSMRAKIRRLERRASYLSAYVPEHETATGTSAHHARGELAALEWAIPVLQAHADAAYATARAREAERDDQQRRAA